MDAHAQQQIPDMNGLSAVKETKILSVIGKKSDHFLKRMQKNTERQLDHLKKKEKLLRCKLEKQDSALAARIFEQSPTSHDPFFADTIRDESGLPRKFPLAYNSYLDSLQTALSFLNVHKIPKQSIADAENVMPPILRKLDAVQESLNRSAAMNKYLEERQQFLTEKLASLGMIKEMKGLVKKMNLYKLKASEYKNMLEKPALIEARLLEILARQKAFANFFNKHSLLAGLFRMPGNEAAQEPSISGLQTRQLLQQETQQRLGSGSELSQMTRQQATGSGGDLLNLKDKLSDLQNSKEAGDLPAANINPNRAKTFLQRLELGVNFQNISSSSYFPSITDVGLSVAYRINEKSIVGLGSSGKIGWGKDIRHIVVTAQGVSLRSFAELRIKGAFHAMGAFEMHYNKPFDNIQHLYGMTDWSKSGLLGVSRVMPLSGRFVKGTKLMLLWDFLSYRQVPRRPAITFRIGYNFK
jgi:hypothetical protein